MTSPQVFVKRPVTHEAWQWDGSPECADLITDWVDTGGGYAYLHPYEQLIVFGNDVSPAKPGDWIIRDQFNDFWPIGEDMFPAVYSRLL